MRMLKIGDVGEDVRQVQRDLMDSSYDDSAYKNLFKEELAKHKLPLEKLAPDARFGVKTQAAVIAYQRFKGLKSTNGVVGPETRTALHGMVVHIRATAFAGSLGGPPPHLHLDPSFYLNWAEAIKKLPNSQVPTPPAPIHAKETQKLILRPGLTYNNPFLGSYTDNYWTMNLDVLLLIDNWSDFKLSGDVGYAGPIGKTPGSVPSYMASLVASFGKDIYEGKKLNLGANGSFKFGFGYAGSSSDPTDPSPFMSGSAQAGPYIAIHMPWGQDLVVSGGVGLTLKGAHSFDKDKNTASGNYTGMVNIWLQKTQKPPTRH